MASPPPPLTSQSAAVSNNGEQPPPFLSSSPPPPPPPPAAPPSSASSSEQQTHQVKQQSRPSSPKTFFQSLRSWTSFKEYLASIRDFLLIAKPVEALLFQTGVVYDQDLARFLGRVAATVIYTLLFTSLLGTLGIDTKPLVAGIGVSGFIVGFTLKEVATNLLSGILLVLQRPFKTGWKIKVAGHLGIVQSIDSRYVRLITDDGQIILLPSYQVYSAAITVVEKKNVPPSAAAGGGAKPSASIP